MYLVEKHLDAPTNRLSLINIAIFATVVRMVKSHDQFFVRFLRRKSRPILCSLVISCKLIAVCYCTVPHDVWHKSNYHCIKCA